MNKVLKILFFIVFSIIICSVNMKGNGNMPDILVYSKTNGYRHEATPQALDALQKLATHNNWNIKFTEDSTYFTTQNLDGYDVIIFALTLGEILDDTGKEAFKSYIKSGKGLVTIHTGTITLQEWPWFRELIGAQFVGHPPVQEGKLIVEDFNNPSTSFIKDKEIIWTEEWYSFDKNPRQNVTVLMSVDESTYDVDDNKWFEGVKQRMGDHPLVWRHEKEGGRVFQTALGHEAGDYSNEFLIKHITGAIKWAGRLAD